jgi:hypothetical protein
MSYAHDYHEGQPNYHPPFRRCTTAAENANVVRKTRTPS